MAAVTGGDFSKMAAGIMSFAKMAAERGTLCMDDTCFDEFLSQMLGADREKAFIERGGPKVSAESPRVCPSSAGGEAVAA